MSSEHVFSFCFASFPLLGVLLGADVPDLEGLLGSLETAESHGTKSRAYRYVST